MSAVMSTLANNCDVSTAANGLASDCNTVIPSTTFTALSALTPNPATYLFLGAFTVRYARVFVGAYANLTVKSCPIKETPRYTEKDATVAVPTTFKDPQELMKCLKRIDACAPKEIIIVTADANTRLVRDMCTLNNIANFKVLGVEKLNKRAQMINALQEVQSPIVVFADDDVFWPKDYLKYLLAVFENPQVGAGGTRQRVKRSSEPNVWNILGISYLERRQFFNYFTTDSWLGRKLNTDDDKCLTRWVYSHGYDIKIQSDHRSVIETTLEDNPKYLAQCNRWARAHWRGNFTVMTNEKYWRSLRFWWGFLVIYMGQFQTPALLVDGSLIALLAIAIQDCSPNAKMVIFTAFIVWILFTKTIKMIPHFGRYPKDLVFLPILWIFSYLHGFVNIYALCTLHNTLWGSQKLDELAKQRINVVGESNLLDGAINHSDMHQAPNVDKILNKGRDMFSAKSEPVILEVEE